MLEAGRSQVLSPIYSLVFFNVPNPCSLTVTLGLTQTLTEMSTRNIPEGKERPARKADYLTTICESIV
jgi:hypothetical protein